jgi:hypothetical protein
MAMPGAISASDALFQRNLEVIRQHYPEVAQKIEAITQPLSSPVVENGVVVDLDLGRGRLYKEDGRALALKQAEDFIKEPRRVGYQVGNAMTGDSLISKRLFDRMLVSIRDHQAKVHTGAPVGRAGFLFVFGLGLGYHLAPLADAIEADGLVVVESIAEFVMQSLRTVDWQALLDRCAEKNMQLYLVLGETPTQISLGIQQATSGHSELVLDGSYYYRHYPSWALDRSFEDLVNNVPLRMVQRGYYEDERKMLWNTIANLEKYDCHMVDGVFQQPVPAPAFLVTSGPSVDMDIEYIKEWRDHVVLFSGGSSLQVLLAHGIIPDYHVELENVVQVWDFFEHMLDLNADKFPDRRFTGIKLIASVTVNPRVSALFDESYYFFRDSVSSTRCFHPPYAVMTAIGPNVANTIVAVAARIGFRHIYMFGMDCGWRDGESHHSRNTAYYTSKTFKTEKAVGDYSFPGNFGGTIQSNLVLSWTRDMLEEKVNKFHLRAFNCSDGALIKGATPKLAETIAFKGPTLDRERVYAQVRDTAHAVPRGSHLKNFDFDGVVSEIDAFEQAILDLCDEAVAEGHDFAWMQRRLGKIETGWSNLPYPRVYAIFQGATIGMAKCGCVFLNRIDDEDKCKKVFLDFIEEYRAIHVEMAQEARAIFIDAKAWIQGGPEPKWALGLPTTPGYTY